MPNKKSRDERIIKYLKDNKNDSIIFKMACEGLEKYNLNLDDVLYHIIIYQNTNINTLKNYLEKLSGKN